MLGVVIGRFQPFHCSHENLIRYALNSHDKVLVIIGSSFRSRSFRNPFTYEERKRMIGAIFPNICTAPGKVYIEPSEDCIDDIVWGKNIGRIINNYAIDDNVCIYGAPKNLKFNKKFFKGRRYTYSEYVCNFGVNGTTVRDLLYKGRKVEGIVPGAVLFALNDFDENIFKTLSEIPTKNNFIQGIYVTVDNVVLWRNHIVLIKRKDNGLYALPGGYLEKNERIIVGALRELEEETGLTKDILIPLRDFVVDNINRSGFGRLISHVFKWRCDHQKDAPKIKGEDDAKEASWMDCDILHHLKNEFHDDHYQIIDHVRKGL